MGASYPGLAPPIVSTGASTPPRSDPTNNYLYRDSPDDAKVAIALEKGISDSTGALPPAKDVHVLTRSQQTRLDIKNHFLAMVGEFVGTVLFIFFAFGGTQVANIPTTSVTGATSTTSSASTGPSEDIIASPNTSSLLFIALSFGFSLTVNAWVFFRISGGLFNPAISLGLALVGVITPVRAILLSVTQCLGAITGAAIIQALLPGPLYTTTRLGGGMSPVRGMFLEMFLTAMLMLTIFLLAAEKSKATFLAPVGIGLALFITQLVGVYYTGASVNPARSLGPDVVLRKFPSYHWIYWIGPILGSLLAAGFYKMMKVLHYETVVPDQDADTDVQDTKGRPIHPMGPGMGDYNAKGHNLGADIDSSAHPGSKYAFPPVKHPKNNPLMG